MVKNAQRMLGIPVRAKWALKTSAPRDAKSARAEYNETLKHAPLCETRKSWSRAERGKKAKRSGAQQSPPPPPRDAATVALADAATRQQLVEARDAAVQRAEEAKAALEVFDGASAV